MAPGIQGGLDFKKLFNTHIHTHAHILLGMPYNFCFIKCSLKCTVWPGEVFWPKEASLRVDFFSNIHIIHSWVMIFNCSKFHSNWSNGLDFYSEHTHTHIKLYILDKIARSLTFDIYLFSLNLFI